MWPVALRSRSTWEEREEKKRKYIEWLKKLAFSESFGERKAYNEMKAEGRKPEEEAGHRGYSLAEDLQAESAEKTLNQYIRNQQ